MCVRPPESSRPTFRAPGCRVRTAVAEHGNQVGQAAFPAQRVKLLGHSWLVPSTSFSTGQAPASGDGSAAGAMVAAAAGDGQTTSPGHGDTAEPITKSTRGGSGCMVTPLRPEPHQNTSGSVFSIGVVGFSSNMPPVPSAGDPETDSATTTPEGLRRG